MNRRGFLGRLLAGAVLGAVNGWLPDRVRAVAFDPPQATEWRVRLIRNGPETPEMREWIDKAEESLQTQLQGQLDAGARFLRLQVADPIMEPGSTVTAWIVPARKPWREVLR